MRELLKDIVNGYDSVVKSIVLDKNFKEIKVVLSARSLSKKGWITLHLRFLGVKEFCIKQNKNFSNTVLSDSLFYGKLKGVKYIDFLPLCEEMTLEEMRESEFYIAAEDIIYTIEEYVI